MKNKNLIFAGMFLIVLTLSLVSVSASASRVNVFGAGSSFGQNYGGSSLFPSFEESMCAEGTDFIIQVAPFGCTPTVVRSDLLEEQNVPVFCQLSATKLNPLIKVEAIESISFDGELPDGVSGVGFHPSRAAVSGSSKSLLNSPILQNVGYAVIVLEQQNNESDMADYIEGSLTANLRYDPELAFGVGKPTLYIPQIVDDEEWAQNYQRYAFWNGKGYLRVENVDENEATIGVYADQYRKLSTVIVKKGQTSDNIYLPGYYCSAGAGIRLDDLKNPDTRARIDVSGVGVSEVIEGDYFLDNKCKVTDIRKSGIIQQVEGYCKADEGTENFFFSISPKVVIEVNGEKEYSIGDVLATNDDGTKRIFLGYIGEDVVEGGKTEYFIVPVVSTAKTKEEFLQRSVYKTLPDYISAFQYEPGFKPAMLFTSLSKYSFGTLFIFVNALKSGDYPLGAYYLGKGSTTEDSYLDFSSGVAGLIDTSKGFPSTTIKFIDYAGAVDRDYGAVFKNNFDKAIADYKLIIMSFPSEKADVADTETFGERAYIDAIQLAKDNEQRRTAMELCNDFEDAYPKKFQEFSSLCLNSVFASSEGVLSQAFLIDGRSKVLGFEGVREPSIDEYSATVYIGPSAKEYSGSRTLMMNQQLYLSQNESIILKEIGDTYAVFDVRGVEHTTAKTYVYEPQSLKIRNGESQLVGDKKYSLSLSDINLKKFAKVSVIPDIQTRGTSANFTFKVGIEKRAIQLSPKQIQDQIRKTDKMITQWESISEKLGTVVKSLKTACLGTGLFLTTKNFLTNLDGQSIARKEVMRADGGWTDICKGLVGTGDDKLYKSMDQCFSEHSEEIDGDVDVVSRAISSQKAITDENCGERYVEILDNFNKLTLAQYESSLLTLDVKTTFNNGCKDNILSLSQAKDLERYQLILIGGGASAGLNESSTDRINSILKDIGANSKGKADATSLANSFNIGSTDVMGVSTKDLKKVYYTGKTFVDIKTGIISGGGTVQDNDKVQIVKDFATNKDYLIVLGEGGVVAQTFGMTKVGTKYSLSLETESNSLELEFAQTGEYKNPIKNYQDLGILKYFETAPYKGEPAVVPFDVKDGWYVQSKQTISGFGNIRAYDASGASVSFYICNVGVNGKIEEGNSDDICMLFNPGLGQVYGTFPGLDVGKTNDLVTKAQSAIRQAQQGYKSGVKEVTINGVAFKVGIPAMDIPDIQCQDVMSPDDCLLLFNVCDPVICPSSRCDFGGQYPVPNVIQSGIIGSIALCLPNIQEGIVMPVCLTGVQAGIDGILSIMHNYRDCMQESSETGKMVGVCDEIYSIYLCEFFWKQALPFADLLVPKALETLTGQGGRGGGEYLGVQDAYDTAGKSVDFMASYYGKESFDAFKVRATDSIEAAVCKSSVSGTFPSSAELLDNLIEPASPFQYNAWFSDTIFTTATVPSTSQYKVFYHIYAGKERGASYSVYLKSPTGGSYFQSIPTFTVASGFIGVGDYASETKDFTAPTGYQELCVSVNGQDECGFNKVSTSFVLDQANRMYLDEQATETNIKTEAECISGTSSAYSLLQPNVQATAEDLLDPQLYNQGIVRVCSTENPGKGTDALYNSGNSRWAQVGVCDERGNLKCWIDTTSVKSAIANEYTSGQTLAEIQKNQLENIKRDLEAGGIKSLTDTDVSDVSKLPSQQIVDTVDEDFLMRAIYNYQKGQLLIYRAEAYGKLAFVIREAVSINGYRIWAKAEEYRQNNWDEYTEIGGVKDYSLTCARFVTRVLVEAGVRANGIVAPAPNTCPTDTVQDLSKVLSDSKCFRKITDPMKLEKGDVVLFKEKGYTDTGGYRHSSIFDSYDLSDVDNPLRVIYDPGASEGLSPVKLGGQTFYLNEGSTSKDGDLYFVEAHRFICEYDKSEDERFKVAEVSDDSEMVSGGEVGGIDILVDTEFISKTCTIANDLEIKDAGYLLAVMHFETGGTFNPAEKNKAGSGATGLIQFLPKTATGLGTSVEQLEKMSRLEQLRYVEMYLKPYVGKLNNLEDIYMSVLWPKAVGESNDYVLWEGITKDVTYLQNRGLDKNSDKKITKSEATSNVKVIYEKDYSSIDCEESVEWQIIEYDYPVEDSLFLKYDFVNYRWIASNDKDGDFVSVGNFDYLEHWKKIVDKLKTESTYERGIRNLMDLAIEDSDKLFIGGIIFEGDQERKRFVFSGGVVEEILNAEGKPISGSISPSIQYSEGIWRYSMGQDSLYSLTNFDVKDSTFIKQFLNELNSMDFYKGAYYIFNFNSVVEESKICSTCGNGFVNWCRKDECDLINKKWASKGVTCTFADNLLINGCLSSKKVDILVERKWIPVVSLTPLRDNVICGIAESDYNNLMRVYYLGGWKWSNGELATSSNKKYSPGICIEIGNSFTRDVWDAYFRMGGWKKISVDQFYKNQNLAVEDLKKINDYFESPK